MSAARPLSILFWTCLLLAAVHQHLQHIARISIPMADAWLDPLLLMPVLLELLRLERRLLLRQPGYRLPAVHIIAYWILIAMVSEVMFPALHPGFTADWLDMVCYGLGAAAYAWTAYRN